MNSLAGLYRSEGNFAESEALYGKALDAERKGIGEEHPFGLETLNGLASTYQVEGKYAQSEGLYTKALGIARRVLGDAHPRTLGALSSLGRVNLQRQNYSGAAATLREALAGYEKAMPDAWERFDCQSLLGAALAGQKKYAEAEPLLLSGFDGLLKRQAAIAARPALSEAADRIARLYAAWDRPAQAAEWRSKREAALAGRH
jgi:tetratricopeptide (TPR) repeat protein